MSSNPAETSPLKSLLSKLWDVGQRKLEQFQPRNNGEAMQADLATRLLPEWRRITDNLAVDPSSLDYISPSVTLPTTSVKLPPEAPRHPEDSLELLVYKARAIAFLGGPLSNSVHSATPQVQVRFAEIMPESLTQLIAARDGLKSLIEQPSSGWLGTSEYHRRRTAQSYTLALNETEVIGLQVVGKGAYSTPGEGSEGVNLFGTEIGTDLGARTSVFVLNRIIGPKSRHPITSLDIKLKPEDVVVIDHELGLVAEAIRQACCE